MDDNVVLQFLSSYGEWAELEVTFIAANVEAGAKVVDAGAFLGTFGISLSQHVALDSVCFVEANARVVGCLKHNVENNCRAPSVVLEALLCGSKSSPATAYRHAGNEGSVSFVKRPGAVADPNVPAPSVYFDLPELWQKHGPFDLLKLDIEGMELSVLGGARDLLSEQLFAVWAECNEDEGSLDVSDFLLSCGLRVFYFAFPSHNPDNWNRQQQAIFPFSFEAGLYAGKVAPQLDPALVNAGCFLTEILDRESLRKALWRTPRGCPPDMASDKPEIALAKALRAVRGLRFDKFLNGHDDEQSGAIEASDRYAELARSMDDCVKQSAELRVALAEAQSLVEQRTVERDAYLIQTTDLQGALASAELLVRQRTDERDAAVEQLALSQKAIVDAEVLVDQRTQERDEALLKSAELQNGLTKAEGLVAQRTGERDAALAGFAKAEDLVEQRTSERDAALAGFAKAEDLVEQRTSERDAALAGLAKAEAIVAQITRERDGFAGAFALAETATKRLSDQVRWADDVAQDRLILLQQLQASNADLTALLDGEHAARAAAEADRNAMLQSSSWRVTAPIRRLVMLSRGR